MRIPLEDQFQDVIGKARRGLKLSESQLTQKAGIEMQQLEALQGGEFHADPAAKIAGVLDLGPEALRALGEGSWFPEELAPPASFRHFNTAFEDMTVNSYLVWDPASRRAAAFDTGSDSAGMLEAIRDNDLKVDAIFLTHTHPDHVADLERLVAETGAPVYVSQAEKVGGSTPIESGATFEVGALKISARETSGHSRGGFTYVVEGLDEPLAIVGDALFAGSMGGVPPEYYPAALEMNRKNILSLPDGAIVCPGHGPLTTVGEEKRHNPFYS